MSNFQKVLVAIAPHGNPTIISGGTGYALKHTKVISIRRRF